MSVSAAAAAGGVLPGTPAGGPHRRADAARNRQRLEERVQTLAKRIGFRIGAGLRERVIYRELHPFGLTVDECLAGVTREAARALGLQDRTGVLAAGKACDLAIWDTERPAELIYRMGFNPLHARVWAGR